MAVSVPHVRVELFGTLCSNAEKWSMGFSTAPPGGGGLVDADALALTAMTLFQADVWGFGAIQSAWPATATFVGARVHQYDAAGKSIAAGERVQASPAAGADTTALPPQTSVVVSLLTGTPGARNRGRMYFPSPGRTALTATGRLSTTARDVLRDRMKVFLDHWNADPVTMPAAVASNAGLFVASVTSIRVGDVVDTQRRRRDSLPEAYAVGTIVI